MFPAMPNETMPSLRPEGFPGQRLVIIPPAIVVSASRQPVTRDLCVTHIGAFAAAGGHYIERPRGTSQHILLVCISGKGHAILKSREWQVTPGDLLFLPPREAHSYGADPRSPWTILWAHFRGERAADYLSMLGVSRDQPLVTVSDTAPLVGAFEDAFHHVTYGFGLAAMMGLSTGFARMLGLARVLQRTSGSQPPKTESRLLQTLALLREAPEKSWTVEQMAHEAGLSVPHFTDLCRRQTGMPPLAYLIRLRLQRAMDLLQQGHCNVVEAARAVGYDDAFYFSRLFRKHLGMPPSACRQGP
jgi:AraC-like DNA-binding protein